MAAGSIRFPTFVAKARKQRKGEGRRGRKGGVVAALRRFSFVCSLSPFRSEGFPLGHFAPRLKDLEMAVMQQENRNVDE
jgi:hypothetical protein